MATQRTILGILAIVLSAATATAQWRPIATEKLRPVRPEEPASHLPAGADVFVVTVGAWEFAPRFAGTQYGEANAPAPLTMRAIMGDTEMVSNVHLPTGAIIDSIELDYCDDSPALDISVFLFDCLDDAGGPGGCTQLGTAVTSGSSGCGFANSGPINATVDNTNHDYVLDLFLVSALDYGIRGVKVYYRLQVSPAPAVATFGDVPLSDEAFQFIEAFAKAGITVGCQAQPPLYCPDATVTRRQMAVFFAKALGLRWPG